MNKRILVMVGALLVVAMMLAPIALAKPWNEKNNPKFETFTTSFVPNLGPIIAAAADPEFIPSEDHPQKVITSWVEVMDAYIITVDGVDYFLGTDFEYSGVAVVTALGAPFAPNPFGILNGKQTHFRVDYMYDFSAPGGIDGTIKMLALVLKGAAVSPGEMMISSTQGTGDLQNVCIKATGGGGFTHIGIVSGWPE